MKIILLIIILLIFNGCSEDKQVSSSKVEYQLKIYFQERFIKLECIGNRETFKLVNNQAIPKEVNLTFKAKVKIDGKMKTIVGKMSGFSGVGVSGFGNWQSDPYIFFAISLKNDWHVARKDEKTEYFCSGNTFNIKKLLNIFKEEKPFIFTNLNTNFTSTRFWHEIRIAEKMCKDGNEKYCKYYNDYTNSRGRSLYATTAKKKLFNEFKERYYSRLCEQNSSIGCKKLEILSK